MLRDLIGKRVRVINKHAQRYGQIGTIVGIQRSANEVDLQDLAWQGEAVEVDPDAEVDWDELNERQQGEPVANEGLRSLIVCFGEETAMLYDELEVLDRGAAQQKPASG